MAETGTEEQRRNWAAAVASDASHVALAAFRRAGFSDPTLILRWEAIAGPETARLARPVKFREGPRGGILTLMAEPGAALFLQHESRALCERINAFLGRPAVAQLRFLQGALTERPAPPPRPRLSAPVPPGDPARKYEGPEGLRTALLKLARTRQNWANKPR